MSQIARPSSDLAATLIFPLFTDHWSLPAYSAVNEVSPDDSTYTDLPAQTSVSAGDEQPHVFGLPAISQPTDLTATSIAVRIRRVAAGTGDSVVSLQFYVMDVTSGRTVGPFQVDTLDNVPVDGAFHQFSTIVDLTSLPLAGVADWNNLAVVLTLRSGATVNTPHVRVSWLNVTFDGSRWWSLASEIVDGLRYRFSLVRNWYQLATGSPGTGWASSSVPAAFGVFQSTDGYTGAGTVITSGLPANPRSFAEIATFATGATETLGGSPGLGVVFDNLLVYPAKSYTVGTDLPPIRVYDGVADREFVRLPKTAAGVVPKAIVSMLVANGTIYLSTFDSGTSSADWAGRIFALSITDGTLTQVGDDVFTSGQLPYALAWHANQLWVGTHRQALTAKGALYRIRPELTSPTWTKDADLAANSSVASLFSFQGRLYVGTMYASGTFAKVLVRDYTGVYTTADTGTGGSAVDGNAYLGLCEFSGSLYAAFWNNDTAPVAKIRKYDGASWSTVYSTLAKPFAAVFVENGYLYAYSVGLSYPASLIRSSDGSSWADLSAQIVGSSQGLPLVGVVVL